MKIEDIEEEVKKDLKVDNIRIDDEAISSSILSQKYLNMVAKQAYQLKKLEADFKRIQRDTWLYYSGKAPKEVYESRGEFGLKVLKQDLDLFIESDEIYVDMKLKVDEQKELVAYLEGVLKTINNRHWQLRNIIEWRKLTSFQLPDD